MGYSRKGLRTYFFENTHGIFFCLFTLLLEIRDKSKLHPWKLCKIALHPMEIPWPKTSGFHIIFSWSILEIPHAISFFDTPGNFMSSTPPRTLLPLVGFISGIAQCKDGVYFLFLFFIWFWLVFHPSWFCPLRTGEWVFFGQNLLSVMKVICWQSLN